ncbi:MAG TPA: PAS domain-containing protein [Spirochaetota bacterium]|nr:PAS domain-containing protein [Spirochaetota bacterium]
MKAISLPIFVISGITAYVSVSFLFLYRYLREREHLFFSIAALTATFYNICCILLYNSSSITQSITFLYLQKISLSFLAVSMLWFFVGLTGQRNKLIRNFYTLFFALFCVSLFFIPGDLIYELTMPLTHTVMFFGYRTHFYEPRSGAIGYLHSVISISAIIYLIYIVMVNSRRKNENFGYPIRNWKAMIVVLIIFFATACNDILVSMKIIHTPYFLEYGFLGLAIYMSLSIASNHSLTRLRLNKSISDQRLAYDKLERSELRLKSIIEHANELIFTLSTGYNITFLSPAWERMLGYSIDGSLGKSWFHYIAENDVPLFMDAFEKRSPEIVIEYRILHKNGMWIWHRATCVPVFNEKKQILYYVGLSQDIMENMQAVEALRYSEERLHSIIDNANDVIFTLSSSGIITFVSPAWERSLGYPSPRVIKKSLSSFIHEDDAELFSGYLVETREGNTENKSVECRVRHLDSAWRWHRLNAAIVRDSNNVLLYYVCISQDVTGQREAAQKLLDSERRLEMALIGAKQGLWDWKFGSGEVLFHQSFENIIGYKPEDIEMNYSALIDFIHPDDLGPGLWAIKSHMNGETPNFEAEYRVRTINDEQKWVQVRGQIFDRDSEGNPLRAVGTYMDITKKKLAEEELKRSLLEKEILIKEIHHRVKNNFQIIISLMNLQCTNISDEQVLRIFNDFQHRIRSMALVHEKMYHSSELSKIDFSDYARSIVNEIIGVNIKESSDIAVNMDFEHVHLDIETAIPCGLILNELVTNIFKYAFPPHFSGDPEINLRIKSGQGDTVDLFIADNGVGLPDEIDFRNTDTLGLQLIIILAENQLKGTVEVIRNRGTGFHIVFPVNR